MATFLVIGWRSGFVGIRYANKEASVFLPLFCNHPMGIACLTLEL